MSLIPGTDGLKGLLESFRRRRVLVLGDAILDEYLYGDCGRISPEAPVPVLQVLRTRRVLGGAANTAANVVSLGGSATLICLAGEDEAGASLGTLAGECGVDVIGVDHGGATLRKTRVVSQQQQMIRLDYEALHSATSPAAERAIRDAFEAHLANTDVVVISDYAKGFLSKTLAQTIIAGAHEAGRQVIVDPRPQNLACYRGCDYLTPNWREARELLRWPIAPVSHGAAEETARALAAELGAHVMLTLGANGIMFCSRDSAEMFSHPTLAREVFDVSGAGDTVVAAFALARAAGADHSAAVVFANRAASVVVGKFGTATVTPGEILQDGEESRIVTRQGLKPLAAALSARGRRIVTINGSFDVLHNGHLHILNEARQCGDVLIVGLNSDASVRSYKGDSRPIVPEQQRAEMLLALRPVDYVHVFNESDPIAFLEQVQPDVHVNGSEYGENCIESETVKRGGGRIHVVERIPGLSTTNLLSVMRTAGAGRS
jgi:D-beta-D-heptose 7-phosphate kinase/D-beta-D-heptose 1-phosphate adenosyltransferase